MDGLERSGDPDGKNIQAEGRSWSTLEQGYADGSREEIKLTIERVRGTPGSAVPGHETVYLRR